VQFDADAHKKKKEQKLKGHALAEEIVSGIYNFSNAFN
jgi:hypothetical protein